MIFVTLLDYLLLELFRNWVHLESKSLEFKESYHQLSWQPCDDLGFYGEIISKLNLT